MRTRIIIGSLLIVLTIGVFFVDGFFDRAAPCLMITSVVLAAFGTREFVGMIPSQRRPNLPLCITGSVVLILFHWIPDPLVRTQFAPTAEWGGMTWALNGWVAFTLIALTYGVLTYDASGESINRVAMAILVVTYLGILPGYLIELRRSPPLAVANQFLLLAIFVPKGTDIGAYFTGVFLGRHRMTPLLSPKKTWQGAAGGLVAGVLTAILIHCVMGHSILPGHLSGGFLGDAFFGITIGMAAIIGDLAESMIKRDFGSKDAGSVLPEFGGVLDIVDSILFAAPVVYFWLVGFGYWLIMVSDFWLEKHLRN